MSNDIVTIGLAVDSSQVKEGTSELDKFGRKASQTEMATDGLNVKLASLAASALSVASALAGIKAVISTSAEFEQYQIRMQHLLGSVQEGNKAFNDMIVLARKMPFEFKDIMGAATQLSGVVKGGADEINRLMPMIGDLAAVSGLSIQQTTDQVARMFSAGASSADMFRERGILSMLGFQSGVTYSVQQTREMLINAWEEPTSKFRGASLDLAKSWDGLMSMMGDQWTLFKKSVGDAGAFGATKGALQGLLDELNANTKGAENLSVILSDGIVNSIEATVTAIALGTKSFYGFESSVKMTTAELFHLGGEAVDFILAGLDKMYGALAMLPGSVGEPYAQAQKTIEEARKTVQGFASAANDDVDSIARQFTVTSDKIDAEAVKMISAIEKGKAAAGQSPINTIGGDHAATDPITGGDPQLTAKQLQQRLQTIDQSLMTETESIQNAYAQRSEIVQQAVDNHLITAARGHQIELRLEKQKNDAMAALDKKAHQERLAGVQGMFSNLSSLMNTHNRAAFEVGKAAAIANTVITTYSSAQKAFDSLAGIPVVGPALGAAAAAAAIAAGVARVQAIQSTSFGSQSAGVAAGGGTPNVGGGGTAVPNSVQPAQQGQQGQQPAQVQIHLHGDPSLVDDGTLARVGEKLAPIIQQNFDRNAQMAVSA